MAITYLNKYTITNVRVTAKTVKPSIQDTIITYFIITKYVIIIARVTDKSVKPTTVPYDWE